MKIRRFLHRCLVISLLGVSALACWGAFQLPPFGDNDIHFERSISSCYVDINIQYGLLDIAFMSSDGFLGMGAFRYRQEFFGSVIYVENRQPMLYCSVGGIDEELPSTGPISIIAVIQLWQVALISAIYPMLSFFIAWRRKRNVTVNPNVCETCGYDLRGNELSTCPECGHEMSEGKRKAAVE